MTSPIIDFIEARLEEDRALAQAAVDDLYGEDDCFFDTSNAHICDHYLRHQPSRVLREVAAKRALLADFADELRDAERHEDVDMIEAYTRLLGVLAAVYSDHPDFDPNWSTT